MALDAAQVMASYFANPDEHTDADLLGRFVAARDGEAFALLVRRHGPMVFGVCRRITGEWHLAEDAFQATFVVLARKAAVVSPPGAVAGWLHGVAHRVARNARRAASRRLQVERPVDDFPDPAAPLQPDADRDFRGVLDDELRKLPGKYRELLVACDLEGRPRQPVAEGLGIPEGTLSSRLTAARKMLADRLAKRGIAPAVVAGVAASGPPVAAREVPRVLLASAARIGSAAPGTVPAGVATLATGAIRAMTIRTYLPWAAGVLVAVSAALGYAAKRPDPEPPGPAPKPALALAVGEQAPAKAEPKPLPKGPNRLLVWRKGELVTIDPDGKNEEAAMSGKEGVHPHMFSLSPDGTKVAIVHPAEVVANAPVHLFVSDVGQKDSGVDLGPAGLALWSADGTELVVCQFGDGPKPEDVRSTCEIVTLATKTRTPLKIPTDHFIIDWSRDGRTFLTLKWGGEPGNVFVNLFVMNRDGTEPKQLTEGKVAITIGRLSPDGKRVLCV